MKNVKRQLREDKALRDAARELIDANIAHMRELISPAQLRAQATDSIAKKEQSAKSGVKSALQSTAKQANDKKGYLAAGAGALIVWFARKPILALVDVIAQNLVKDSEESSDEIDASETEQNDREQS